MSETIRTYSGVISNELWIDDHYDAVRVDGEPIARSVSDDMERFGHYLSVRYAITEQTMSIDDALMQVVDRLEGDGREINHGGDTTYKVDYEPHYSEITGYLWTDESLIVGGHDLLQELASYAGKYAVIEVTYNTDPPGEEWRR